MLTNQILLFHFETVATPCLQYVTPILVQFKVADFLECERWSSLIDRLIGHLLSIKGFGNNKIVTNECIRDMGQRLQGEEALRI